MMVNDLYIEEEFVEDYDYAPDSIRKKVDRIVNTVASQGSFPKSFNSHKANSSYIWIGYVTCSRQHWRILFDVDEYTNEVYFLRLVTHQEMDKLLREYSKV